MDSAGSDHRALKNRKRAEVRGHPACGSGAILDVLRAAGHIVHGSDIADYGWPHTVGRDYLAGPVEMNGVAIVTNPPYRLAHKFIKKALDDSTRFAAFLLRLNFLESMRRKELFETHPPSRVWVSSRRLPMMHRHGFQGAFKSLLSVVRLGRIQGEGAP